MNKGESGSYRSAWVTEREAHAVDEVLPLHASWLLMLSLNLFLPPVEYEDKNAIRKANYQYGIRSKACVDGWTIEILSCYLIGSCC